MSSEIIHADIVVNEINDKISSISSQIAEQIEVILEVVLWEVSKLIDSMLSMKQEDHRKHSFLEKKKLHKIKNDSLLTNTQKYLTNWWIALWS